MSQSNEGDSPVKGGKEPCQRSLEYHYLRTVARREKSCAHSQQGTSNACHHVHTPSKEHQTRATNIMAGKDYQYRKMVFN